MYDVTIRFQFPAWDERDGITYSNIVARNKSEAIRIVRRMAYSDGHIGAGGKGRTYLTATALTGIALALAALWATIGPPRLIGYGCDSWPSVKLAIEESDFLQPCERIEPLPWATE